MMPVEIPAIFVVLPVDIHTLALLTIFGFLAYKHERCLYNSPVINDEYFHTGDFREAGGRSKPVYRHMVSFHWLQLRVRGGNVNLPSYNVDVMAGTWLNPRSHLLILKAEISISIQLTIEVKTPLLQVFIHHLDRKSHFLQYWAFD